MSNASLTHHRVLALACAFLLSNGATAVRADDSVALKHSLYGAGYGISNVDPGIDRTTITALKAFQKDHGLAVTGELDKKTRKALGLPPLPVAKAATAEVPAANAGVVISDSTARPVQKPRKAELKEEREDGSWLFF